MGFHENFTVWWWYKREDKYRDVSGLAETGSEYRFAVLLLFAGLCLQFVWFRSYSVP
jgi:hypothetical protein